MGTRRGVPYAGAGRLVRALKRWDGRKRLDCWKVADSPMGIVIACRGHDKQHTAHAAVTAFNAIANFRGGNFTILADLREMTGYETDSRKAWQTCFYAHRARVVRLVLVGARSPMIRMGAATVGAVAAIPVTFVSSWDELPTLGAAL